MQWDELAPDCVSYGRLLTVMNMRRSRKHADQAEHKYALELLHELAILHKRTMENQNNEWRKFSD